MSAPSGSGSLTLVVVTTFLGGVRLVFLGMIGDMLALMFDEVKARATFIVQHHYRKS